MSNDLHTIELPCGPYLCKSEEFAAAIDSINEIMQSMCGPVSITSLTFEFTNRDFWADMDDLEKYEDQVTGSTWTFNRTGHFEMTATVIG